MENYGFLLAILGFVIGLPLSFIAPALFYKIKKTPIEKRNSGFIFRFLMALAFMVATMVIIVAVVILKLVVGHS